MSDESWSWFGPDGRVESAQPDRDRPGRAWLAQIARWRLAWIWLGGSAAVASFGLVVAAIVHGGGVGPVQAPVDRLVVIPGGSSGAAPGARPVSRQGGAASDSAMNDTGTVGSAEARMGDVAPVGGPGPGAGSVPTTRTGPATRSPTPTPTRSPTPTATAVPSAGPTAPPATSTTAPPPTATTTTAPTTPTPYPTAP